MHVEVADTFKVELKTSKFRSSHYDRSNTDRPIGLTDNNIGQRSGRPSAPHTTPGNRSCSRSPRRLRAIWTTATLIWSASLRFISDVFSHSRLLSNARCHDHITPVLATVHGFQSETAVLVWKCLGYMMKPHVTWPSCEFWLPPRIVVFSNGRRRLEQGRVSGF